MYCINCGAKIENNVNACAVCGTPVVKANAAFAGQPAAGSAAYVAPITDVASGQHYASWEYVRTTVRNDLSTVTTDCYGSLGYELTGVKNDEMRHVTTLSFRRSRKLHGKAQLVKIQRTMDDLIASIADMEGEKTRKGSLRALTLGIVSALVLGVGMCCTMVWTGLMIPGIIIGVIGIIGCVAAYLLYRSTCAKEAERINPRIEAAYDSLATACEEAQAVLRPQQA